MPLYEFECGDCGESFEELVRSSSAIDKVLCPTCQSQQIHKKVSSFASKIAGGSSLSFGSTTSAASCSSGSI